MGDRALSSSLVSWLARLEQRAPQSQIKLGLDRVRQVYQRLDLNSENRTIVTIGGTNGKGSTVAFLEASALAAGYRTFAYTSPHLIEFAERFRINGQQAADNLIIDALDLVEEAREDAHLSYFEHTTLAGFVLAEHAEVDLWVLEVGLGGRLDAVNVLDPDVAVITSIGLDHTEWLGPTRLDVGREKVGIARPERALVLAETRPPAGLDQVLQDSGAVLWRSGQEYRSRRHGDSFDLYWNDQRMRLPLPELAGSWQQSNAAAAVMAAVLLRSRLPMSAKAIAQGLSSARVTGRLQVVSRAPEILLDVAHNPAAARALAHYLSEIPFSTTIAVFAALADKDVVGIGRALRTSFDDWLLAPLDSDRARPTDEIAELLMDAAVTGRVNTVESLGLALARAESLAGAEGRIVVFGSFRTVAEAWPFFDSH